MNVIIKSQHFLFAKAKLKQCNRQQWWKASKYDFDVTNQCTRYGVERGLICNKLMRRMLFEGFFYWLITFIQLDSHLFQLVYSFLSIRALCSSLYLRYAFLFIFLLFFSFLDTISNYYLHYYYFFLKCLIKNLKKEKFVYGRINNEKSIITTINLKRFFLLWRLMWWFARPQIKNIYILTNPFCTMTL